MNYTDAPGTEWRSSQREIYMECYRSLEHGDFGKGRRRAAITTQCKERMLAIAVLSLPAVFQDPFVDAAEHRVAVGEYVVRLLPRLPERGRAAVKHVQPAGEALVQDDLTRNVHAPVL